jgi:hypothetical protein
MENLDSLVQTFHRLTYLCPLTHVSAVFSVIFGVFNSSLDQYHFVKEETPNDKQGEEA